MTVLWLCKLYKNSLFTQPFGPVVSQRVGCEGKKLKKTQQEWHKNFAEMEKGFCFKQSSLIATSNY